MYVVYLFHDMLYTSKKKKYAIINQNDTGIFL